MKKIISFVVGLCMAFAVLLPIHAEVKDVKADGATTPIDMYLIAGESNALGSSLHNGKLTDEYTNVGYADTTSASSFENFKWSVKAGYGSDDTKIGLEYGMAQALNDSYSGDKKAFIFKSAANGTALHDSQDDRSNWYPRSLWEEGYDPATANQPTGYQYSSFVEGFATVYNELKDNGYEPKVRGMVWMQGESDLGLHELYEELIKLFITDIREDIEEITGDEALSQMPFVMGKVATTFGEYENENVPAFNETLDKVASSMVNVETVETADLIIVNQDGTVNGSDTQHFNGKDEETLGVRFAEKLLRYAGLSYVTPITENGHISYNYNEENDLVLSFVPDKNYKFQSVVVNGLDMTTNVVDGKLTLEKPAEVLEVKATFTELAKYYVTYDDLGEYCAKFVNKASYCYEGDVLQVRIQIEEGYEILSVKFNNEGMTYNEELGCYEIVPTAHGHVTVSFKEPEEIPEEDPVDSTESSVSDGAGFGCNSSIGIGTIALLAVMGAAYVALKRKH